MNIDTFGFAILFFLPAAIANASASVLMRKTFLRNFLPIPVDLGYKFKGEYLIGKHKTYGGWIVASLTAGLFGLVLHYLILEIKYFGDIFVLELTPLSHFALGFLLGFGAIGGDLVESAVKRRVGVPQGRAWFPFDQIDFIIGALLLSLLMTVLEIQVYLWIFISFFMLHLVAKVIGYLLGIDKSFI